MQLQKALEAYARDNGLAAADALIIESAQDGDLAKLGAPLKALTTSEGRKVGLGDEGASEILLALLALLR